MTSPLEQILITHTQGLFVSNTVKLEMFTDINVCEFAILKVFRTIKVCDFSSSQSKLCVPNEQFSIIASFNWIY